MDIALLTANANQLRHTMELCEPFRWYFQTIFSYRDFYMRALKVELNLISDFRDRCEFSSAGLFSLSYSPSPFCCRWQCLIFFWLLKDLIWIWNWKQSPSLFRWWPLASCWLSDWPVVRRTSPSATSTTPPSAAWPSSSSSSTSSPPPLGGRIMIALQLFEVEALHWRGRKE